MIPHVSPEREEPPTPSRLRDDWITAVLLPLGAFAGLIVLFALGTTGRLVVAGVTEPRDDGLVSVFGTAIGSTDVLPGWLWASGWLALFVGVGGTLGFLAGNLLRRMVR